MYGKCYIYKRATLINGNGQPQIIDYSDGTEPFNCEVEQINGNLVYRWKLNGEIIDIPLNVRRNKVDSILRNGNLGDIQYEFIFGKFRTFTQFYTDQLIQLLPLMIVLLILMYIVSQGRTKTLL